VRALRPEKPSVGVSHSNLTAGGAKFCRAEIEISAPETDLYNPDRLNDFHKKNRACPVFSLKAAAFFARPF
jgi:hypothetical protein